MSKQTTAKVPQIRFKGFKGEWENRQFRDIVSSLSGGASIKPGNYQSYGVRTVPKGAVNSTGIADLAGSKFVTKEFFERNTTSQVSTGDLVTSLRDLVPSAPNLGRIVKIKGVSEDFLMPQGVYKIALHANVDENFVISYSNAGEFRKVISSEKNGSTQVHLRNGEFLGITIFTPTHSEQTQIGDYFRELDSLIGLHQRKHDKLVTLKKAMLQKMFPQPGATTPKIRFKGFSGEWVEKKLGELCELFTDGDWIESKDQSASGIRLLQTGNVGVNEFIDKADKARWISLDTFERLKCEEVFAGDILISRLPEPAGRACIVPKLSHRVITAVDCTIVRTAKSCDPAFLVQLCSLDSYFETVNNYLGGGTRQRISRSVLGKLVIQIPKFEEQQKIGNYFRTLDELISKHATQLQKLKQIKSACLEKMFV